MRQPRRPATARALNGTIRSAAALPDEASARAAPGSARSKPHGPVKARSSSSQPSTPSAQRLGEGRDEVLAQPGARARRAIGRAGRPRAGARPSTRRPAPGVAERSSAACASSHGRTAGLALEREPELLDVVVAHPGQEVEVGLAPGRRRRRSLSTPVTRSGSSAAVARACGPPPEAPIGRAPRRRRGGRAAPRRRRPRRRPSVPARRVEPPYPARENVTTRTPGRRGRRRRAAGRGCRPPGVPWWADDDRQRRGHPGPVSWSSRRPSGSVDRLHRSSLGARPSRRVLRVAAPGCGP